LLIVCEASNNACVTTAATATGPQRVVKRLQLARRFLGWQGRTVDFQVFMRPPQP